MINRLVTYFFGPPCTQCVNDYWQYRRWCTKSDTFFAIPLQRVNYVQVTSWTWTAKRAVKNKYGKIAPLSSG